MFTYTCTHNHAILLFFILFYRVFYFGGGGIGHVNQQKNNDVFYSFCMCMHAPCLEHEPRRQTNNSIVIEGNNAPSIQKVRADARECFFLLIKHVIDEKYFGPNIR